MRSPAMLLALVLLVPIAVMPVTAGGATLTASFSPKAGNDWWVETRVSAPVAISAVSASVDGGLPVALAKTSWGSWAKSFHVPPGSLVTFTAKTATGETSRSGAYSWPSATPAVAAPPAFTATFSPKAGNDWWVETRVSANAPVTVSASVNGGAAVALSKTSWGSYAKSFHVTSGSLVRFTARSADGASVTSGAYLWPSAVAAPAPAPAPLPAPSPAPAPADRYPWHTSIIATTFWVGELFDATLADGSQVCSTYDPLWAYHWSGIDNGKVPASAPGCAGSIVGGCDGIPGPNNACSTEKRTAANGYFPTRVTPRENPFYLDLPYDDLNDGVAFAERCAVIPWASDAVYAGRCKDAAFSYMKDRWVRIVGPNGNTCYGQVEDAGPSYGSLYHDKAYVFGAEDARPVQQKFNNAGMDVSPALNGCLGFKELDGQGDRVSWQFVDAKDVPNGPWKRIVTTSGVTPWG